jgi:hypothetical protein
MMIPDAKKRLSGAVPMKRRDDKNKQRCNRSTRMFKENDTWFFKTRGGASVGPFRDELEASTQLEVYIRLVDSGLLPAPDELAADSMSVRNTG